MVAWLNLLHRSPTFVLSEDGGLIQPASVPPSAGMTLIAGTTVAAVGERIDSVFEVWADGGELFGVYWLIGGKWFRSSDDAAFQALGVGKADMFPFGWEYAVPLDVDHYRDPPRARQPKLP